MTQSIFIHSDNLWSKHLSHRDVIDVINFDLYYALQQQNTNAVRACLSFFKKKQLEDNTLKTLYHQFTAAENFKASTWLSVLRIFHLYDKQYGFAGEWVKHTPSVAHKLQEILQGNHSNEEKLKIQTLVLRYSLATPHVASLTQSISLNDRENVAEQIVQCDMTQWKMSRHSPWNAQTAADVCATFPQYSRAVFLKIAATAYAFEQVNALYTDPNVGNKEYFGALEKAGNDGVTSEMLCLWAIDSSMTFECRQRTVVNDLERMFEAASVEEQNIYLDRLSASPYCAVVKMSPLLESAAQALCLKRNLKRSISDITVGDQQEHTRKI